MSQILISEKTLQDIINKLCAKENMKEVEITSDEVMEKGLIGNSNFLNIKDTKTNRTLHLFIKKRLVNCPLGFVFENEALFYKKIYKKFREIASDQNILPLIPECYHADESLIILENMQKRGFKTWKPLITPLDSKHLISIIKEYAKLHALSFALKHEDPGTFSRLGRKFDAYQGRFEDFTVKDGFYENMCKRVKTAFPEHSKIPKAFENFIFNGSQDFFKDVIDNDINDVFIHGDNWTWNFIFSENDEQLLKTCLLDFQVTRKCSPVADLSSLFCSSGCSRENFAKVDEYLKIYYEHLQELLKVLKCPQNIYTWDKLMYDWKHYTLKCVLHCVVLNKIIVADEDELKVREHIPVPAKLDFTSKNEHVYFDRIRISLEYLFENTRFSEFYY